MSLAGMATVTDMSSTTTTATMVWLDQFIVIYQTMTIWLMIAKILESVVI